MNNQDKERKSSRCQKFRPNSGQFNEILKCTRKIHHQQTQYIRIDVLSSMRRPTLPMGPSQMILYVIPKKGDYYSELSKCSKNFL